MKIEVEDTKEIFQVDPRDFVIDETAIDAELCKLGATMLEYGSMEGRLQVEVEQKKALLDKLWAEMDTGIRAKWVADTSKDKIKLTEGQIKSLITGSVAYQEQFQSLTKSNKNYNLAKAAMKSLSAKRDCLISLSYRDRQLMKADQF